MILGSAIESPLPNVPNVPNVTVLTVPRHDVDGERAGMLVSDARLSNAADTDVDDCREHT